MNPISSIQATPHVLDMAGARRPEAASGPSFKDYFDESMRRLQGADASAQSAAAPTVTRVDTKLLAEVEQAALTMRLVEQVGNRVAATIDEIKQIRV